MNVLLLSCGAKVPLLRAWRAAAAERGGLLTAVDCAEDAVGLFEADRAGLLPHCTAPDWADALSRLCRAQRIAVLVPSADAELRAVARLAPMLEDGGTRVLVSPPAALERCADKAAFIEFCQARGYPVAPLHGAAAESEPSELNPVFVRPRRGRVPDCTGLVRSAARLEAMRAECPELVVQAMIAAPEYSIDVLLDWTGEPLQAVSRRRLRVRGGEATTSRVEQIPALTDLALSLCSELGLIGHVMLQAFYCAAEGAHLIEVNPRFGGASTLAIAAGLDSPRRLLALLAGDASARDPGPIRDGLTLLRYGVDRFVEPGAFASLPRGGELGQ